MKPLGRSLALPCAIVVLWTPQRMPDIFPERQVQCTGEKRADRQKVQRHHHQRRLVIVVVMLVDMIGFGIVMRTVSPMRISR